MRTALTLILLSFSAATLQAQPHIAAKFVPRSFTAGGQTLPYRLFVPDAYDSLQQYPLVLALHHAGLRGTDNLAQVQNSRIATSWADPLNQAKYPCLVVAPQCPPPPQTWWEYRTLLNDLLDSLSREFSVDTNRLYVTGASMGGYGTLGMIATFPNRFAAAIPICGGLFPIPPSVIAHVPIWDFHGTLDDAVPVEESRYVMEGLEQSGVQVVYTHCRYANCEGLSDSALTMFRRSHAQAFYTEYGTGGHDIWDQSYDYPFLFPWVFAQYRRTPGAIRLTSLKSYEAVNGVLTIEWSGGRPEDSVEIWYSGDIGRSWQEIVSGAPNQGSYGWNTMAVPDVPFATIRVFLKNPKGFIYGMDASAFFAVDNAGNGAPFVHLSGRQFERGTPLTADSLTVSFLAGDPDGDPLTVILSYSPDNGKTYQQFSAFPTSTDTLPQSQVVLLPSLPNAVTARIKVTASDGSHQGSDSTFWFAKQSPRQSGQAPAQVAGGGGKITVHVVNAAALTGNRYRVSFNDTLFPYKVYDVTDMTKGSAVVQYAREMDGTAEGPEFDGLRLVVRDVPLALPDPDSTRWLRAAPTIIPVSPYLPTVLVGADLVAGFPYPADYLIEFAGGFVDTSSDLLAGFPPLPVRFTVRNVTEDVGAVFVFADNDFSGSVSNFDEIYMLEPDSVGQRRLSWGLTFAGAQENTLPEPGDVFFFRTVKPISRSDIYEFDGVLVSVPDGQLPQHADLSQNYPNPFNPTTTIAYDLSVASDVRLTVYDLLGRPVQMLAHGRQPAGHYAVQFEGSRLASGVYFYRLQAGEFVRTKRMLLLK